MALLKCAFCLLLVSSILGMSVDAYAQPQHQQNSGARQNPEKRRFQFQEFRANRRLERQLDKQNSTISDRERISARKDLSTFLPADGREENNNHKFNRLSPEERIALRRQIKEARQDIYLRRQEKK